MKQSAPAAENEWAMAFPSPLLPPVTSATLPLRLNNVLCIEFLSRLANGPQERLNVRPGLVRVNQPVPPAGIGRGENPLDTLQDNLTIRQNHAKQSSLCITSHLPHRKTSRTPLYTGAVVRPGRNNGKPLRAK